MKIKKEKDLKVRLTLCVELVTKEAENSLQQGILRQQKNESTVIMKRILCSTLKIKRNKQRSIHE